MPSTTICNQITSLCGATIMNELSVKVAMPSNSVTKSHCVTQHRQGIRKCSGKYRRARYQEMLSSISWAEAVHSQREFVCKEEHEDRIIHTYTGLLCQRVSFPRFFFRGHSNKKCLYLCYSSHYLLVAVGRRWMDDDAHGHGHPSVIWIGGEHPIKI